MTPDVVIRRCREEDLAVLEAVSPSPGRSRFHHRRFERQQAGEVVYLIAWLDGAPVGNLCLILDGPSSPQARVGLPAGPELNAFDVVPSQRNRGIGSALAAEAERTAAALGHTATVVGVDIGNEDAHRLYRRLGYQDWSGGAVHDSYTWMDEDGVERVQEEVVCWLAKSLDVETQEDGRA